MPVTEQTQDGIERHPGPGVSSFWRRHISLLLIGLFSVIYFGRTLLRAAEKPFWYDELCTLYITRMPTLGQSWAAEMHGADYNPPFFYVIHRAARALFGDSQLALRLPEIFSFWVFSLCMFRFVSKRAGWAASSIALALPMVTGAYYYATEARPHGLILGFLGLALICWQELQENPNRRGWRIGFAVALGAACFIHCYAVLLVVPFGVVELWYSFRKKTVRWREWITLFLPPAAAVLSFFPLLRSYHAVLGKTTFSHRFAPKLSQVFDFFTFVFAPCWIVVAIAILLYVVRRHRTAKGSTPTGRPMRHEFVLIGALLLLPVFGLLLAVVMHSPVLVRYVLGATAGCVLLIAFAFASQASSRFATLIAVLLAIYISAQFAETVRLRHKGLADFMVEPNGSEFIFSRNLSDPMAEYSIFKQYASRNEPVVVHGLLDFLYMWHYAPERRPQLYSVSPTVDIAYKLNKAVREGCHLNLNREQLLDEFLAQQQDFQIYGTRSDFPMLENLFKRRGAVITDLKWGDNGHFLLQMHVPARTISESSPR